MQSPSSSLRRTPVQQRSADRLDRILDACAGVLDESGYEALTTRAVAVRADVPIGSVYRFFSDKRAMAEALARRNLDAYTTQVESRLRELPGDGWRAGLDVCFDTYVDMKRTVPGFILLDFGPPDGRDAGEVNRRVAEQLHGLLTGHLGRDPSGGRLALACLVGVHAADALLRLAFRTDPAGDQELIAETRALLSTYLADVLDRQ